MSDVEENDFCTNNETAQNCPQKRRLSVNWDKCLCHGFLSSGGKLERFTQKSWDRLCMAAKRRQDDV